MSSLQIPGQVGLGVLLLPGPNAMPVGTSLQEGLNQVRIVVAGGLTKRQDLAARFIAAFCSEGMLVGEIHTAIQNALRITDALLAATEPKADSITPKGTL